MIQELPLFINVVFVLTTFATVLLFYRAAYKSHVVIYLLLLWLMFQGIMAYEGYYLNIENHPPRILFPLAFPLITIVLVLFTQQGRKFTNFLNGTLLTYLQFIRFPLGLLTLWLFNHGYLPKSMTFQGLALEIVIAFSAPFVAFFGMKRRYLNNLTLMCWNVVALALFANMVIQCVIASPYVFANYKYQQPIIAFLYFPFVWLPACIVPLVIFSHVAVLKRISMEKETKF